MYRLYDYLPSGNSYKPRLLLSLLGIDYATRAGVFEIAEAI